MAQVVQDVRARIDRLLGYLTDEWEDIPTLAQEWDEVGRVVQADFRIEWPIKIEAMRDLKKYADQGLLSPDQCARYDELLLLVDRNRPVLERLLAET